MKNLYFTLKEILAIFIIFIFLQCSILGVISKTNSDDYFSLETKTQYQNQSTNWTILLYLAWDNHMDTLKDKLFTILNTIDYTEDLNIVVLYDGRSIGDTSYYYFGSNGVHNLQWVENESNMGDGETLKMFLHKTINSYHSTYYGLFIISSHGSGWQGLGCDTHGSGSSEDMDLISAESYGEVLHNITSFHDKKIDVVGFDTCVSGSIEIAYEIAPYVGYMIANEDNSFSIEDTFLSDEGKPVGWMYSVFLNYLNEHTSIRPEEFAVSVVHAFQPSTLTPKIFEVFTAPDWYPLNIFHTDLAAINLSILEDLKKPLKTLSDRLNENYEYYAMDIHLSRESVREYGKLYRKFWWLPPRLTYFLYIEPLGYDGFIDLYDFTERLSNSVESIDIKDTCTQIMDLIHSSILIQKSLPDDASHGLSVYFPEWKCQYDISIWKWIGNGKYSHIITPYKNMKFSRDTHWNLLVENYFINK